ncbi:MAG: hypothetical protein GY751_07600 [Bacteroidetes bacterium]|nr:hypothetical protein [Bacteroidota bacterium]
MIPVGYMYKEVCKKPEWLKTESVKDVYSVSGCVSEDFDDWVNEWKHNGYWLFDSPKAMEAIAKEKDIDLSKMKLFFYKASEQQWDEDDQEWESYQPEESFKTEVTTPNKSKLEGYDVVSFYANTSCECSPLSCNHLAESIKVNEHCLLKTYEEAIDLINSGELKDCEPGPYRIFEVHSVILA